jgi:hypothetical protein
VNEILLTLSNIAATNDRNCIMHVNALLQAGVFTHIAPHIVSEHESIRQESQWTISNALVNASNSDRTAIIGTSSFRALLTASTTNRITPLARQLCKRALKETWMPSWRWHHKTSCNLSQLVRTNRSILFTPHVPHPRMANWALLQPLKDGFRE